MTDFNPTAVHAEMSQSSDALSKAATHFDLTQINVNKDLVEVSEKITLYSAAIISLSLTFVGSVANATSRPFDAIFLGHPLKYTLFVAWSLMLTAFISGLFVRWFNARHIYWTAATEWLKKRQRLRRAKIQYLGTGLTVVLTGGGSKEAYAAQEAEYLANDKKLCDELDGKNAFAVSVKAFLQYACFLTFGFGIAVLTISMMVAVSHL